MKWVAPSKRLDKLFFFIFNKKSYIIVIFASVFLTSIILSSLNNPQKNEKLYYLVTKHIITEGEQIKESDLTTQEFVNGFTPLNSYRKEEISDIIGLSSKVNLEAGTLITKSIIGNFEEAPILRIARTVPGKKVIYFKSEVFHTIPPIIKKQNLVDIVAYPTEALRLRVNDPKPEVLVIKAIVVDLRYSATSTQKDIEQIGLALDDQQIWNMFNKMNRDWTLNIIFSN